MKKLLFAIAAVALSITSFAQTWKLDDAHTKLRFTTKYLLISDVDGEIKKVEGTFTSAKEDWSDLKADVRADVNNITTENDMRDKHLKSDDFFNAEKFPSISFKSTGIKSLGNKKFLMKGELTIRDVTKTVEFPLVYGGTVTDPWGNVKAGFKATGTINRKDYGLKYSNAAKTGEAVVGDNVDFTLDAILIKQ